MMMPARVSCMVCVGAIESGGSRSLDIALAKPKSRTFTRPSLVTLMLAGFRSRWTMPRSCAYSSASAICLAMDSASSIGIAPRAIRSASVGPSTNSITSARSSTP